MAAPRGTKKETLNALNALHASSPPVVGVPIASATRKKTGG
jgi:hypothetical protein